MDWSTALVLAGVMWIDGVRRVSPSAVVLRRVLARSWSAVRADSEPGRLHLTTCWTPLTAALVLPDDRSTSHAEHPARPWRDADRFLRLRLARTRPHVRALRVLGTFVLLLLVLGVPWATRWYGAWGLGAASAGVLTFSIAVAVVAGTGYRAVGSTRAGATRAVIGFASPFAAPRAADALLAHAVSGTPTDLVCHALLPPVVFAALVRPRAFDAVGRVRFVSTEPTPGAAEPERDVLVDLFGPEFLATIVRGPPTDCAPGEVYCPRCGSTYRADVQTCADCDSICLVGLRAAAPVVDAVGAAHAVGRTSGDDVRVP